VGREVGAADVESVGEGVGDADGGSVAAGIMDGSSTGGGGAGHSGTGSPLKYSLGKVAPFLTSFDHITPSSPSPVHACSPAGMDSG